MTKKALVSTAELKRLARVAKDTGITIEVEVDGIIVRLMQSSGKVNEHAPREPEHKPLPRTLAEWRESQATVGKGGYPIVDGKNHRVQEFYDRLGFDPRTMDETDMARLQAEAYEKWKASVPGRKVGKRERDALEKLSEIGIGIRVPSKDLKGCTYDTVERLVARGFIDRHTTPGEESPTGFEIEEVWLLDQGLDAARSQQQASKGK